MEVPQAVCVLCPLGEGCRVPGAFRPLRQSWMALHSAKKGSPFPTSSTSTSQPMHGQQKTWNEGLVWTSLLQTVPWPYAWGIPVFQESPASYQQYHKAEQ